MTGKDLQKAGWGERGKGEGECNTQGRKGACGKNKLSRRFSSQEIIARTETSRNHWAVVIRDTEETPESSSPRTEKSRSGEQRTEDREPRTQVWKQLPHSAQECSLSAPFSAPPRLCPLPGSGVLAQCLVPHSSSACTSGAQEGERGTQH